MWQLVILLMYFDSTPRSQRANAITEKMILIDAFWEKLISWGFMRIDQGQHCLILCYQRRKVTKFINMRPVMDW